MQTNVDKVLTPEEYSDIFRKGRSPLVPCAIKEQTKEVPESPKPQGIESIRVPFETFQNVGDVLRTMEQPIASIGVVWEISYQEGVPAHSEPVWEVKFS